MMTYSMKNEDGNWIIVQLGDGTWLKIRVEIVDPDEDPYPRDSFGRWTSDSDGER